MSNFYKENIRLQEAMSMDIQQEVRVWETPGAQVQDSDLPKDAKVSETFVSKQDDYCWKVGMNWTIEGDLNSYTGTVAEFSTLEELQSQFPQLFELEGNLFAFF